jgi:hypothetical protein
VNRQSVEITPNTIYITQTRVQSPRTCNFLEATLVDMLWQIEVGDTFHNQYSCTPFDFVSMEQFGEQADGQLYVLPNLVYIGDHVVCRSLPVPFEEYVHGKLLRPAKKSSGSHSESGGKVSVHLMDRVQEELPWLTRDDIEKAFASQTSSDTSVHRKPHLGSHPNSDNKPSVGAADDSAPGPAATPVDDSEELAELMDELAKDRVEWAWDDEATQIHFYVHQRGGVSTAKQKGVALDGASANCRSHVSAWCISWNWPRQPTFAFSVHTKEGANELAKEWCRKGHYFFESFLDAESPDEFDFTDLQATYAPSEEFMDWALSIDLESDTWARVQDVLNRMPGRG